MAWKGTAINPTGSYDKIYFNTSLSVDEVVKIIEGLNYLEMDLPSYPIYLGTTSSTLQIVKEVSEDNIIFYQIYAWDNNTQFYAGKYFDSRNGWLVEGAVDIVLSGGMNEIPGAGITIGSQNELLSSLISATPFEEDNTIKKSIVLNPIVNGIKDENVHLYPRTVITNDENGNPMKSVEFSISNEEPSEEAVDAKKMTVNGREFRFASGGGSGETLEYELTEDQKLEGAIPITSEEYDKVAEEKVSKIKIKTTSNVLTGYTIEDYFFAGIIDVPDFIPYKIYMYASFSPQGNAFGIPTISTLGVTNADGELMIILMGEMQSLRQDVKIGLSATNSEEDIIGGVFENFGFQRLYILANNDIEALDGGSSHLFATTQGIINYVAKREEAIKSYVDTKLEESVTTALSDDYTIGG